MSMLVLIFFSFLAVGLSTIFRYQSKNKEYHKERLKRKDRAVVQSIKYMTHPKELSLEKQYRETDILQKLSSIHKLNINIYDLEGRFIAGSDTNHLKGNNLTKELVNTIIKKLNNQEKRVREIQDKKEVLQIYTVLYYNQNPYAILNIPYNSSELNNINEESTKRGSPYQ